MAVSEDRKYTREFVYQLLESVKGKTLGEVDKSHQFARCSLFHPPFAAGIIFKYHPLRNCIIRPITGVHEALVSRIPIPIVSRAKMIAQIKTALLFLMGMRFEEIYQLSG